MCYPYGMELFLTVMFVLLFFTCCLTGVSFILVQLAEALSVLFTGRSLDEWKTRL